MLNAARIPRGVYLPKNGIEKPRRLEVFGAKFIGDIRLLTKYPEQA